MLGHYKNFPQTIHHLKTFASSLPRKKLQFHIVKLFEEINHESFSFEQVCNPSVPNSTIIFEFGIADDSSFNFLNDEESKKLRNMLMGEPMQVMDWFCVLRYYKDGASKREPLRFDYYILRMIFGEKGVVEFLVFHEHGPRYVSPGELVDFIARKTNLSSRKKILNSIGD